MRNVGQRAGAEVPQVYLGAPSQSRPGVDFAVTQLAGFTRVVLRPGQATRVTVRIDRRSLAYWSRAIRLRGRTRVAR